MAKLLWSFYEKKYFDMLYHTTPTLLFYSLYEIIGNIEKEQEQEQNARSQGEYLSNMAKRFSGISGSLSQMPKVSSFNSFKARCSTFFLFSPFIKAGKQTFSNAVNSANKLWNWKTNPIFSFRKIERFLSESFVISVLLIQTLPEVGFSRVPRICNRVVFPAPESPIIEINSPSFMCKFTPFKTFRFI